MIRVADYIANFLVENGVGDIFMLTGNGAMYLNDAIGKANIRYFCARNEAAAPMMAEGYARLRDSLGAVCLTSGPGSTNAIPGLAEAFVDSAPIVVISGQVQRSHTTHNAGIPGLRTFGTAEIDIIPIVAPLTKYAVMVNEPDSIRYHLEKAVHSATTGRPGPVWLDIPMDIQYALVDPDKLQGYDAPPVFSAGPDLDAAVAKVVSLIKKAKRPLLVAGHGVRQSGGRENLKALVESAEIPVILSRLGQDLLPYSHPLSLGTGGIKGTRFCGPVMKAADLVLSLGCRLAVQFAGHNFDAFDPDAKVVMVDIDEAELKKSGVPLHLAVHSDVKLFMEKLSAALASESLPDWSEWAEHCADIKNKHPMVTPEYQRDPIDLYYFMSRLDALAKDNHDFVTDAGSNYYVGGQVYHFESGQREVTSGTFAAMGLTIPLSIGAAVARPDAQILAVTGDGSLELNIQELKTMSHYGFDIKLFVINNGGYLSMRNWQDGFFEGRRLDTAEATGVGTLDLERIARAFDLNYARIERVKDIDAQILSCMEQPGPLFVEVVCDDQQKIVSPIKDLAFDVSSADD
jgi:acetolactate synthase-1/2/3 large subunit